MSSRLKPGEILNYPYLWRWQRERGETAGRKERPVCVVVAVKATGGRTHLALLAISSRPPQSDQIAIEVPQIERRRAGLSDSTTAWVTVSEYNYDIAEQSFHLGPNEPVLGRFSRSFMMRLAKDVAPLFAGRQGRIDRRD